jgi:hypothetical protein
MRFMLSVINEDIGEDHVDAEFASMEVLMNYVKQCGYAWTSLVVIVLPSKENNNEA